MAYNPPMPPRKTTKSKPTDAQSHLHPEADISARSQIAAWVVDPGGNELLLVSKLSK